MYISSFRIDGFGILSNVEVGELPPGLVIFLGRNEAGKSTCLEFLRATLTGYPSGKQKKMYREKWEPVNGGQWGGSLLISNPVTGGANDDVRLTRHANGNLSLHAQDGRTIAVDALSRMLSGINRDVYRKIFGFSLGELEQFESLNDEGVRNALYGASFGAELRSPAEVLKELARSRDDILKKNNEWSIKKLSFGLEQIRAKIEATQKAAVDYDRLTLDLRAKNEELKSLETKNDSLFAERRLMERRLDIWQQWEEWHLLDAQLQKMPPKPENFPEDGTARLERFKDKREALETSLISCKENLQKLRQKRDSFEIDYALLEHMPLLRSLSERKSGYRQALTLISSQQMECDKARQDMENGLAQLGPDWDCARIRATDRSVFVLDNVEKSAREMNEASIAHQTAMDYLDQANGEVELAGRSLEEANNALDQIPQPATDMNDAERDELRRKMARLEDVRRQAPVADKALESAGHAFRRSLEHSRLFPSDYLDKILSGADAEDGQARASGIINNLLKSQDEAAEISHEMDSCLKDASEIAANAQQAEQNAEILKRKIDELRSRRRNTTGPSRDSLDTRAVALRSLRSVYTNIETEKERLAELDSRIKSEQIPHRITSWILPFFGIIFFLTGIGIFAVFKVLHVSHVEFSGYSIPINLWAAYLSIFCGLVLLTATWHGNGPEKKRRKLALEQLSGRRNICEAHLSELASQAMHLGQVAGLEKMDPLAITSTEILLSLDASELLLEREREQCFHEETFLREIRSVEVEYGLAMAHARELKEKQRNKDIAVLNCRKRWHALMQHLEIILVPSPESAPTVFARAEAAMLAHENLERARQTSNEVWNELNVLEDSMANMPAVARCLEKMERAGLENAVRMVLEKYREADEARDKRLAAEATVQSIKSELERARERQLAASSQLEKTKDRLDTARKTWEKCLDHIGLGQTLDPPTVRAAFECMKNCLASEDRLAKAETQLAMSKGELETFESPLCDISQQLKIEPSTGPDGGKDWLATLDALLFKADSHSAAKLEMENVVALVSDKELELGNIEVEYKLALDRENELLAAANVDNEEDFLRLSRENAQRLQLEKEKEIHEIAISEAARNSDQSFDEFVQSFRNDDREIRIAELGKIREELQTIADRSKEISIAIGALKSRRENLCHESGIAGSLQDEAMLMESLQLQALEWSRYALAEELLKKAKNRFENERQPQVIAIASNIFAQITNNRWQGIHSSLEDSSLSVLDKNGNSISPVNLSRGAQEQLYLSLRLAYVKDHALHATALPVIMDEILVNFDPDRAERAARAIVDLAGDQTRQQVFYFTCQPHMVEVLRSAAPGAPLYHVENGTISAAV